MNVLLVLELKFLAEFKSHELACVFYGYFLERNSWCKFRIEMAFLLCELLNDVLTSTSLL